MTKCIKVGFQMMRLETNLLGSDDSIKHLATLTSMIRPISNHAIMIHAPSDEGLQLNSPRRRGLNHALVDWMREIWSTTDISTDSEI